MARRKKNNDELIKIKFGIIAIIIFLIVKFGLYVGFFVLSLVPIIFLLGFLRFWIKQIRVPLESKKNIDDYWLTEQEKEEFVNYENTIDEYRDYRWEARQKINELHEEAEENNLSKNVDGTYSKRTEVGKRIGLAIEKYNRQRDEYWDIIWDEMKKQRKLSYLPCERWLEDNNLYQQKMLFAGKKRAYFFSILAWVMSSAAIIHFGLPYVSYSIQKLYKEVQLYLNYDAYMAIDIDQIQSLPYIPVVILAISAILAFLVKKMFTAMAESKFDKWEEFGSEEIVLKDNDDDDDKKEWKESGFRKSHSVYLPKLKPPYVTMDNLNSYNKKVKE